MKTRDYYLLLTVPLPLLFGSLSGKWGKPDKQYDNLKRPPLNPPKFVFPIAWTILYLLIGASYYLVFRRLNSLNNPLFYAMIGHLMINYSYSPVFFYYRQLFWSAVICSLTLITAVYLYIAFWKYDKSGGASYLLIPYISWLLFANYLAWTIYWIN
jgi:benzodiazapine receptor